MIDPSDQSYTWSDNRRGALIGHLPRRRIAKIIDALRKLDERLKGKSLRRHRRTTRRCRIPIGPLAPNGDAASRWLAQDQRLGRTNTPGFEDGKTLPSKGMEWMTHLSPSQRLVEYLGSSR